MKKGYSILVFLSFVTVFIGLIYAAVPQSTNPDTIQQYANDTSVVRADYVIVDGDYFQYYGGEYYNFTAAVEGLLGIRPVNEWGLVFGTTGDWFNYTVLEDAVPVYIGLQMHPLNITYDGVLVLPVVYDKDATHWQLALYWVNGTQITDDTNLMVMYYAHIDWDNPDGLTYIEANGEQL